MIDIEKYFKTSSKVIEDLSDHKELIKQISTKIIDCYKNFGYLDKNLNKILNLKSPFIEKSIIKSCNLKKMVVEKDETEKNFRKVLNLGHTFAHSYESTLGFSKKLNHGEAVILGIKNAAEFSHNNNILSKRKLNIILNHIKKIGMNPKILNFFKKKDAGKILSFMKSDKKNSSQNINLILIN